MININILEHCENLLWSQQWNTYVRSSISKLSNNIEQVFPMGAAVK